MQGEVTLSLPQIEEYLEIKLEPGTYTFTVVANRNDKQSSPATKQFEITPEGSDEITWGTGFQSDNVPGIILNFDSNTTLNKIEAYFQSNSNYGSNLVFVYIKENGEWSENRKANLSHTMSINREPEDIDGKAAYLTTFNITGGYTFEANKDYMLIFSNVHWDSNHSMLVHTKNIKSYNKGLCAISGNGIEWVGPFIDETQKPYIYINGELT